MRGEIGAEKKNPGGRAGRAGAIGRIRDDSEVTPSRPLGKDAAGPLWLDRAAFLRERENFVTRQLLMDVSLPPHAHAVVNTIARHVNVEEGAAYVSIAAMAAAFNLSHDTVARCIDAAEAAGHIWVQRGRGRGQTHRIGWIMKPETATGPWRGLDHENVVPSPKAPKNSAGLRSFSAGKNSAALRSFKTENSANRPDKTPQVCGPNNLLNNEGGRASRAPAVSGSFNDSDEDEFSFIETVAEEGSGAHERARPFSTEAAFDDLDPDAVEALAHLGKPVTLEELDRLAASDPGTDHPTSPDPAAGDEPWHDDDDLEPIGWDEAVNRLAALHGPRLPDPLAFIEAAVFGFIEGDRAAAQEAVAATVHALGGLARPDDRDPLWWSHRTVLAGVFAGEDHRSAAAALEDFERDTRDHFAAQHQPKARETTA